MDAVEPATIPAILRSYPFRLGVYGAITVALYQLVYHGVAARGTGYMGQENGPLEVAQAGFAVLASVCLFYAASRVTVGRAGMIICAALVGYAAARESDTVFEAWFFDDAYKWLVGLPLLAVAVVAVVVQRRKLVPECMWLMRQPAATMYAVAGFYLCGVCQVLDRPELWTHLGPADLATTTSAFVEEFAELFAYMLLAFSSFEAVILARRSLVISVAAEPEQAVRLAA